jgi:hypothetical protein
LFKNAPRRPSIVIVVERYRESKQRLHQTFANQPVEGREQCRTDHAAGWNQGGQGNAASTVGSTDQEKKRLQDGQADADLNGPEERQPRPGRIEPRIGSQSHEKRPSRKAGSDQVAGNRDGPCGTGGQG